MKVLKGAAPAAVASFALLSWHYNVPWDWPDNMKVLAQLASLTSISMVLAVVFK